MSYILDALRKSETDRQQGRVPDLNQSIQMVHKPRRKALPVGVWVALALFVNAAILAIIFWPGSGFLASTVDSHGTEKPETPVRSSAADNPVKDEIPVVVQTEPAKAVVKKAETRPVAETQGTQAAAAEPAPTFAEEAFPEAEAGPVTTDQPTLIVPNREFSDSGDGDRTSAPTFDFADGPPVEHLVEKPLSFQRKIPDLRFSSHIYASDPAARRVMINDNYLRPGDTFSGIRVEAITSDGVVLSAFGETFRVGVVRDWVSPR